MRGRGFVFLKGGQGRLLLVHLAWACCFFFTAKPSNTLHNELILEIILTSVQTSIDQHKNGHKSCGH